MVRKIKSAKERFNIQSDGSIVVPIWLNIEEERRNVKEKLFQELSKKKKELEVQRGKLEKFDKKISALKNMYLKARKELEEGFHEKAINSLLRLFQNSEMKRWRTRIRFKFAMIYIYASKGLIDNAIDYIDDILNEIEFVEAKFPIYYEIGILYEQLGEHAKAKTIYDQFITTMHLDYRDVAERVNNLSHQI